MGKKLSSPRFKINGKYIGYGVGLFILAIVLHLGFKYLFIEDFFITLIFLLSSIIALLLFQTSKAIRQLKDYRQQDVRVSLDDDLKDAISQLAEAIRQLKDYRQQDVRVSLDDDLKDAISQLAEAIRQLKDYRQQDVRVSLVKEYTAREPVRREATPFEETSTSRTVKPETIEVKKLSAKEKKKLIEGAHLWWNSIKDEIYAKYANRVNLAVFKSFLQSKGIKIYDDKVKSGLIISYGPSYLLLPLLPTNIGVSIEFTDLIKDMKKYFEFEDPAIDKEELSDRVADGKFTPAIVYIYKDGSIELLEKGSIR